MGSTTIFVADATTQGDVGGCTAFEVTAPATHNLRILACTLSTQSALGMSVRESQAATTGGSAVTQFADPDTTALPTLTAKKYTTGTNGGTMRKIWSGIVPGATSFPIPFPGGLQQAPVIKAGRVLTIQLETGGTVHASLVLQPEPI